MRVTAPFRNIFGPAVKSVSLHTLLHTALCGEVGAPQAACLLCQGTLQTGHTKGRLAGGVGRGDQPLLVASIPPELPSNSPLPRQQHLIVVAVG